MTLPAGHRDQRITWQIATVSRSGLGQPTKVWANLPTRANDWAMVKVTRVRDDFAAGQMQATCDVVFNVRYRADVTETMRVIWNGEPYELIGFPKLINGQKVDMEVEAVKGVRDGR
jgi:SPP1 family predicted phage head-tail adaptor